MAYVAASQTKFVDKQIIIIKCVVYWANAINIHTPPVEDLPLVSYRGSTNSKWISPQRIFYTLCGRINQSVSQRVCEFQIELHNMQIHLKITLAP